jgi:hypothetical protein
MYSVIMFLSSRQSENIFGSFHLEPDEENILRADSAKTSLAASQNQPGWIF